MFKKTKTAYRIIFLHFPVYLLYFLTARCFQRFQQITLHLLLLLLLVGNPWNIHGVGVGCDLLKGLVSHLPDIEKPALCVKVDGVGVIAKNISRMFYDKEVECFSVFLNYKKPNVNFSFFNDLFGC